MSGPDRNCPRLELSFKGSPYLIVTKRLHLRCWVQEDAPLLKEAIDSSLDHLRRWMPWALHEPETLERKQERIQQFREHFAGRRGYAYGIFARDSGRLLGACSANHRVSATYANLGYWLRTDAERQGYVTEAVAGLTLACFEVLGHPLVEIYCHPANERSAAVPRRLGFTLLEQLQPRVLATGGTRDSQIWQMQSLAFAETPIKKLIEHVTAADGTRLWPLSPTPK